MLQKIRDKAHGWWTWVFVPLFIIIFALFGIQNYLGGSFSQNEVAKVNGESISVSQFSSLYQSVSNAKNSNGNPQVSQTLKMQVLESLISKLMLTQALQDLGLTVSDQNIDQMIYQAPAFQQNGQFSMQLYQAFLQNMGQTTEDIRASLRQSFLIDQFQNGLLISQFSLPNEITTETNYANMLRDITYVTIPVSNFAPTTAPTATDIQNFYTANQNNFMTPLQVKLAYITLSQSQFAKSSVDSSTAQANYSAALNQAANIAFQNPGSLDPIAQTFGVNVQTTGMIDTSHPTGILTNPAVLQAVTSNTVLTQGNNSNVINLSPTQAVIVRVVNSVPQQPLPLSQVQSQVIAQIQASKANQAASAAINSMVNAVNQGGNLANLAKAYGLSVQTATGIGVGNKALAPNILNAALTMGVNQAASIPTSNSSYTLLEVTKAYPNPAANKNAIPAQAIAGLWTQIEMAQYLQSIEDQAKVKINQALFKQD